MANAVNGLSHTTGAANVPEYKMKRGYRYEEDKWTAAELTPQTSETVHPPRIQECQVQMEAALRGKYDMFSGALQIIEVEVLKTHVEDGLRLEGHINRINPDAWHPMIMSFQHLYGLKQGKVSDSKLAKIDEEQYRV
jgi:flavin reductase (DIM6/NTAB) family NADH-FMN oxidoreductase RutF